MFVFDKRLSPEQAINHKPNSRAPFGYMANFDLSLIVTPFIIACKDPSLAAAAPAAAAGAGGAETAGQVNAVALLTRVRWDLGATDPIILEGLVPIMLKQTLVNLLYASLTDISVDFAVKVFEYDPLSTAKKYYACFDAPLLKGKVLKEGDRELAIDLNDNDDLSIQDNSFYAFSIKIVPAGLNQSIILAAKDKAPITKMWGRTNPT